MAVCTKEIVSYCATAQSDSASLVQHYSVYSVFMFILSLVFLLFKKRHLPSCVLPSGKQVQYQNEETEKFDTGIAICS